LVARLLLTARRVSGAGAAGANSRSTLLENVVNPDAGTHADAAISPEKPAPDRPRTPIWLFVVRLVVPILILAGAFMFFSAMVATKPKVKSKPIAERVWIIQTVTAKKISVAPRLRLYGTIAAGRDVEFRPLVAGRVVKVGKNFAEGGLVKKGDLLVEIDPFEYKATVKERDAQLSEARSRLSELNIELMGEETSLKADERQIKIRLREVERRQLLVNRGTGSQKALDDSNLALNDQKQRRTDRLRRVATLKTKIAQQTSVIERAKVALERAERDLRETKLFAPFDGFLRDLQTAVGKKIGVNDRVARLVDARWLEASFQVSDEQYGRLIAAGGVRGKTAKIVWRTRAKTFRYQAVIERISGQVASDSGGVVLYARIKGTDLDTVLRPGVFVQVVIADRVYNNVYRLPDEALVGTNTVYIAVKQKPAAPAKAGKKQKPVWRLAKRLVKVVGRQGNDILVQGKINPGDRVVSSTFPEIGPGAKVTPR
jgi:RND family efflux transporter MFP subunit